MVGKVHQGVCTFAAFVVSEVGSGSPLNSAERWSLAVRTGKADADGLLCVVCALRREAKSESARANWCARASVCAGVRAGHER